MPFVSRKQQAFAHTPKGLKSFGGADAVEEWDAATDFSKLPERAEGGAISRAMKSRRPSAPTAGILSKRFQPK